MSSTQRVKQMDFHRNATSPVRMSESGAGKNANKRYDEMPKRDVR